MGVFDMINIGECTTCKCEVWLPKALNEAALRSRGPNGIRFYCAYGHNMTYAIGETDLDKMRRERDRLAQRVAERDDEVARQRSMRETAERQAAAARGQVTKIKNRVGRGVCPCCNRTFENLARHMMSKHADYTQEAAE